MSLAKQHLGQGFDSPHLHQMSHKIYALGTLKIQEVSKDDYSIKGDHLCTLYAKFEDAEKAILENKGDIFENYYNYALIEETWVIDHSVPTDTKDWFPPKEWWYKATWDDEGEIKIEKCEKPESLDRIVYFWTG